MSRMPPSRRLRASRRAGTMRRMTSLLTPLLGTTRAWDLPHHESEQLLERLLELVGDVVAVVDHSALRLQVVGCSTRSA
jgi:hypothetical protein